MAVADRVEEVAAVEMAVTAMEAATNTVADTVKCMVPNTSHVGKRLRESDHGYSLGCEVPLETE
jgi:hypothetical protein